MTPNPLHKTKHCRFYAQGRCERGGACTYIHDIAHIQASRNAGTTPSSGLGATTSETMQPASSAATTQTTNATLSHPTTTPTTSKQTRSNDHKRPKPKGEARPCFAYRKGSCDKGDKCPYSHDASTQLSVIAGADKRPTDSSSFNQTARERNKRGAVDNSLSGETGQKKQDRRRGQKQGGAGNVSLQAQGRAAAETAARTRAEREAQERVDAAARAQAGLVARERAEAAAREQAEIEARERAEAAALAQAELIARLRVEAADRERERQTRLRAEAAVRERERQARLRAEAAARAQAKREARVRAEAAAREREREHQARLQAEAAARELERQARLQAEREARERAEAAERERQRALEEQERARLVEQARIDSAKTTQRVVLGSIITFGAGLDIQGFTTGFESCIVRVRGIPANAVEREIYALFTQQGIDKARLYLMLNKPLRDGTREVKMAMDAEAGHALSVGLDELEFRDRRLSFEVGTYNIPGTMGASGSKDAEVLTISWQATSARYVVTYSSLSDARQKIQELNGTTHHGRRIRAETNTAPPGRSISVDPNSIKVDNLPASITYEQVSALAGSEALMLRALPTRGAPVTSAPLDVVRQSVLASGCSATDIVSMDLVEAPSEALHGYVKVRVRFHSWDQAKAAHDYLTGRKLFGNVTCRLALPAPLAYIITIPIQQFEAQRDQWATLRDSVRVVGKTLNCSLTQVDVPGKTIVRFRVSGSDKKAVGALKVRVEGLAAGEKVDGWHARLGPHSNGAFVARVREHSGAFLRADWRQRHLKVYGSPQAVTRAREMVAEELLRLAGLELTTNVPPACTRHFLAHGLPELRELLGEDNVRFNPATRILTTSGGDETHHVVSRIIEQAARARTVLSVANEDICPICFDSVSAPVRLGCGHSYCSPCLRHFVASAADSDRFPLVCMGDEAHCNTPIAIPVIERFLSQPVFHRLVDVAFRTHVSQHPLELKYCRTPDCEQIYRAVQQGGPRPVPTQCPACLSVVCPGCHEDSHEGFTCEEYRVRSSPAEQERLVDEWIASQGGRVKRCPQCRVPMEKTAGCNHMSCRCGAHVCWRCLGVFTAGEIYGHMGTAHGGIYEEDHAANERVDYAEQENLLRQAANTRRAAEAQRAAEAERARADLHRRQADNYYNDLVEQRRRERLETQRRFEEAQFAAEVRRREVEERQRQNQGGWCVIM